MEYLPLGEVSDLEPVEGVDALFVAEADEGGESVLVGLYGAVGEFSFSGVDEPVFGFLRTDGFELGIVLPGGGRWWDDVGGEGAVAP
ncbi:hypothetical protein ACFO0N_03295 [Halobium salinum]|uniref:Uncharacterized protein n=1 Tax=Halobium salinum TaxID=1364940 RepID=A0ABD5P7Y7_9EURY|nr:hypothetical protein [Halobium salinum]